jgi:Outer membrane protein beta-barrel domain
MKRIAVIIILTYLVTMTINAQTYISIFTGYGQSSFQEDLFGDDSKIEQAGYVPAGLQIGYDLANMEFGSIFLGAEVDYAVVPFTFELSEDIGNGEQNIADFKINQMVIGALVKVKFGKSNFNPFIRLGGGAYLGGADIEYTEEIKTLYQQQFNQTLEDEELDIKTAFGFNVGAGTDIKMGSSSKFFVEFVYHMVTREPDEDNSESIDANNWAAHVGIQFGLK